MNLHLKDLMSSVVEDDGDSKPKRAVPRIDPQPQAAPHPATPVVSDATVDIPTVDGGDHDEVYQKLLTKSDFTASKVFQILKKYLVPMAGMALDEKTKFNIALQQAKAQEGISPESVLQAFDDAKASLQHAADDFAQTLGNATAQQVDSKNKQASAIGDQVKALQAQAAQLTEEAFASQQKLQTAQHKFDTALKTRSGEIDQEKAKYTSLLA